MISDFLREAGENCALLGHYATSFGNFLPTFKDSLSFLLLGFLTLETGTKTWSWNVAVLRIAQQSAALICLHLKT